MTTTSTLELIGHNLIRVHQIIGVIEEDVRRLAAQAPREPEPEPTDEFEQYDRDMRALDTAMDRLEQVFLALEDKHEPLEPSRDCEL